jgi:hypothetical protein
MQDMPGLHQGIMGKDDKCGICIAIIAKQFIRFQETTLKASFFFLILRISRGWVI